jgi:hypothetical protein
MKQFKGILWSLAFTFVCCLGYAQTVTEVEWWFDEQRADVQQASIGGSDILWTKDIPTGSLKEGLHVLHLRLKDSQGLYSGISSTYFFKPNEGSAQGERRLLYWFDDTLTEAVNVPLSADQTLASLDIDASQLSPGGHTLHFRLGYENGGYIATTTDYFVHGSNPYSSMATDAPVITEYAYWFDVDDENGVSGIFDKPVATTDFVKDIPTASLSPDEEHIFNIRFTRSDGQSVQMSETFNTTNALTIYNPGISLSNGSLQPGKTLTITGLNFTPGGQVAISTDCTDGVTTVAANAEGAFTATVAIPANCPAGLYAVSAKDLGSGKSVMPAQFRVKEPETQSAASHI